MNSLYILKLNFFEFLKKRLIFFITYIMFVAFLTIFGCNSEPYQINEKDAPDKPDSVKVVKNKKQIDSASTTIGDDGNKTQPTYTLAELNKKYPKKYYKVRTVPQFTWQFNIGFNYGVAELNADYESVDQTSQFETGRNFGVRKGFNASTMGKIPIAEEGSIRFIFSGAFNYFNNNNLTSKVSSDGSINYYLYSLGAGFENSFTPIYKVKPYFNGQVLFNIISGNMNYTNDSNSVTDIKIKPSFRIGLNFGTGVEFLMSSSFGINTGISLTSANLLFKSSGQSSDPNSIPLRDKKIDPRIVYSGYKQFLYTTFFLGVNFYFGIKEKPFHI